MSRNALGKGLGALIREPEPTPQPQASGTAAAPALSPTAGPPTMIPQQVDIDLIEPNPYQPRTRFREAALDELARSIQTSGIIQPLVLRRAGNRFQLIAGERRWRAAQKAGLHRVREVPEEEVLEITLVENVQREDLNPVEEARAYERLLHEFHMTQEEVAERTGKERTSIANAVRLLTLDEPVLELIEEGRLSASHGRALLSFADPALRAAMAQRASRRGMTVRQLERFAARKARAAKQAPVSGLDANTRAAVEELERHLGTRVTLKAAGKKKPGSLNIEYYDDAQLEGIYERLMH